jgi:hypothetical protein
MLRATAVKFAVWAAPTTAACTVTVPKAAGITAVEANPVASVRTTHGTAEHAPKFTAALLAEAENVTGTPTTGVTPSPSSTRTANGTDAGAPTATVPEGAETSAIPSGATLPL